MKTKLKLTNEQLNAMVLIDYHTKQIIDLEGDINNGIVCPKEDWKDGWKRETFSESVISPAPSELRHQCETYENAIKYHKEKLESIKKAFPELENTSCDFGSEDYCDVFKFGTEPTVTELLTHIMKIRENEIETQGPETSEVYKLPDAALKALDLIKNELGEGEVTVKLRDALKGLV